MAETLRNRAALAENRNLLFWYGQLYRDQFRNLRNVAQLAILEIGSGVSPLTNFYPSVRTSDVLDLDYLDYVLDCHHLDEFEAIPDHTLDVITLTNVLHHLKSPIEFLINAASKLKPGGLVIATEPYFSAISTPIYKYLHHEPVDFSIEKPELAEVRGPLSSANEALPWLIFTRSAWRKEIEGYYSFEPHPFRPFTALAYFASGGIAHRIPMPFWIYRIFFAFDLGLSRRLSVGVRCVFHDHTHAQIMSLTTFGRRFGNKLYRFAFPVYRPLYSVFKSCSDRAERELLARNLCQGSVVVDAGANIGIYSEFLAKCVGPTGIVHSFEPDPGNFKRLHGALSRRANVRLNQLAVSDQTGESLLYVSDELNVDHRLYPSEGENRRTVTVKCNALDDYLPAGIESIWSRWISKVTSYTRCAGQIDSWRITPGFFFCSNFGPTG